MIIKPYKLDISQFGEKVRDEMKFTIQNVSEKELEIKLVAFPGTYAEVELPEKIKAGQSAEGVVKLKEGRLEESFEKSFTFELNDEQTSRFTVPLKRTVKKPVTQPTAADQAASSKTD